MEPLLIRASRWKYGLVFVSSLGFVVAGVSVLLTDPNRAASERWAAGAAIFFFGGCALVAAWQVFDLRPRLMIDESGILDRTLGVGLIPWSEITDAYVRSVQGSDFICLVVRNPGMWTHKLSPVHKALAKANRALGFTELNINMSGVSADTAQVHELILKFSEAWRKSTSS